MYTVDFVIGGRYQKTQLFLSECDDCEFADLLSVREAFEPFSVKLHTDPESFELLSVFGFPAPAILPKSRAFPGDFGVFAAPKEAKAPDPKPNAPEAPMVGDARAPVEGDMELKGFDFVCEGVSPPWRFTPEKLREVWSVDPVLPVVLAVLSDSLLELEFLCISSLKSRGTQENAYFERRVHKLSIGIKAG